MKLEADYKTTYQGFDPNSIDSYIMFELMQNSYMEQSLQFAEQVQKRFVGHLNREDRGVRQAAFWVLLKTACPSILFEMGFISNPEEERFLNQPASIAQMANAPAMGIQQLERVILALFARLKVGAAIKATTAGRMPWKMDSTTGLSLMWVKNIAMRRMMRNDGSAAPSVALMAPGRRRNL